MSSFLRSVVEADTASLQQVIAVLKARREDRRSHKNAAIFAATYEFLLRKVGMDPVRQILRASMAV